MNKPIKAKNLPLFPIIDLDQLRRENRLEGTEVTDFFTARDGKVYLLMEQPSETQGKDWLSTPSTYTAVEIQLDWAEQRVLETTLFPLGLLKFQFHYLRPAVPVSLFATCRRTLSSAGGKVRLSGKRPRPERLDRQPGRSCAVPFLPGGWHSRLCGKKRWHHHYQLL